MKRNYVHGLFIKLVVCIYIAILLQDTNRSSTRARISATSV